MYAGVCLLIVLTASTMQVQTHAEIGSAAAAAAGGMDHRADATGSVGESGFVHKGVEVPGQRKKRSVIGKLAQLGLNLVWKGMEATEFLLKGAVKARSSKPHVREYQKIGTPMTALKDFRSVDPIYVQKLNLPGGVAGRSGHVGDRTVTLKIRDDSGKPTIEIMKTHKTSEGSMPEIDRITYTKEYYK